MILKGNPYLDWVNGKGKTLEISLNDSKSLADAIGKYIGSRMDIAEAAGEAVEKLCAEGERIAKDNCPEDTGELRESITHEVEVTETGAVGTITAGTDHAMFVEFGTGIVGMDTYPEMPNTATQWQWDVNNHGYKGWNYQGDDGKWHHTIGMRARPFMYETAKELSQRAEEILNGNYH